MNDLRSLLLQLYMRNNPKFAPRTHICSYNGVQDFKTHPFHFAHGEVDPNARRSIIVQNLGLGEMIQGFIEEEVNGDTSSFLLDNIVLYGNRSGVLLEIDLSVEKIARSEKCRHFADLTRHMLRQLL